VRIHTAPKAEGKNPLVRWALLFSTVLTACLLAGSASSRPLPELLLGRSVDGRVIRAIEVGDPAVRRKALVVGCIHGNECAGLAIVRRLERLGPQAGVDLWLVPEANPDGAARNQRQNARGVDLNRNFPWHWRRLPRGTYYSGPRPASEPETQIALHFLRRLHPVVTIWFHQHLRLVDASGGDISIERRFAHLVGLPLVRLGPYPGTVTSWENHYLPGTTAFVVELPAGRLSGAAADRYARAVRAVIRLAS
jgi:protein MpaA